LGKRLIIGLIIIFLPLTILVADLAMAATAVYPEDFTVSDVELSMSPDNLMVTVSFEFTLPKAGFLPKGAIMDLILVNTADDTDIWTTVRDINFDETVTISAIITLNSEWTTVLEGGNSINVKITGAITPNLVGVILPIYWDFPEEPATINPA
jgi:hypothetical protein